MNVMIDNIAAVVIGAVILVTVFALSARTNDSAIEATQVDIAKTDLRSLVDAFEQDLNNMGSGMGRPNAIAAERVVTERLSAGGTETVRFWALPSETATTPQLVTYRWTQSGTYSFFNETTQAQDTAPLFEVERETGSGASTQTGTFENVSDFGLVLRYDDLGHLTPSAYANTDSLTLVRYVDVELAVVSPAGTDGLIQETRWEKRYRPINLEPASRRVIASPP